MKNKAITLAAALVIAATSAFGFNPANPTGQGNWTVSGAAALDTEAAWGRDIKLSLTLGTYIEDEIMVGGYASLWDNDWVTTYTVGATTKWHLLDELIGRSAFSPFVGADVGIGHTKTAAETKTALVIGGRIGFDVFLFPNAALEISGDITVATDDIYMVPWTDESDNGLKNIDITLKVGFVFFF